MQLSRLITAVCLMVHTRLTHCICPDTCICDQDDQQRPYIHCTSGNMNLIPVEQMDHNSQIIVIATPDEFQTNMLTLGPIFTQPRPFAKLEELRIVNSNVPSIGQFSFWGLQNLRILNLTRNNLTSLFPHNFRGLVNLTHLYLDDNSISEMPSETFRHLLELRTLSLTQNQIKTLVPRLFRMLGKLYYLDLSGNPLKELNPEVFKDVQYLRIFKCRRCQIRHLNTQIYHFLSNLEELDMGDNMYDHLSPEEFSSLRRLRVLRLDRNQLPVIVDNMFAHQHALKLLNLSHNRLAMLAEKAFINLTNLRSLDISYNKLGRFELETFAPIIDSLRHLNISGNNLHLREVATILQMFPDIHGVGMANLSIREIPVNFFAYNRHLIELDLSWNNFEIFPDDMLGRIKFLQRLDMSKNKLQGLNEKSLSRLWAIAHINLGDNPWNCEKCDISIMMSYMLTTVLNDTIYKLVCQTPKSLKGVAIGELMDVPLDWCSSNSLHNSPGGGITEEGRLSIVAGLLLIFFVVISAIAGGICYSKRRTAEYYTNEEKRRSNTLERYDNQLVYFCENDNSQHKIPKADARIEESLIEGGSVATIHAPYQLIAKGS